MSYEIITILLRITAQPLDDTFLLRFFIHQKRHADTDQKQGADADCQPGPRIAEHKIGNSLFHNPSEGEQGAAPRSHSHRCYDKTVEEAFHEQYFSQLPACLSNALHDGKFSSPHGQPCHCYVNVVDQTHEN